MFGGKLACCLLLLTTDGSPRPEATVDVSRVVFTADFEAPRMIEKLTGAAEEALPLYEKHTGYELPDEAQIKIHLYGGIEAFRKTMKDLGVAGFDDVGAVTLWGNNESYVVVQPRSEPAYLGAVEDLPEMTLQLVLHEMAHQFEWRAGMYPPKYLPDWYTEGRCEYLSELAMTGGRASRTEDIVKLAGSRSAVANAIVAEQTIPLAQLLSGGLNGSSRRTLFYDQSYSLYSFLANPKSKPWNARFKKFQKALRSKGRPGSDAQVGSVQEEIAEMFRREVRDVDKLEADWIKKNREETGDWFEVWRSSQKVGDDGLISGSVSWESNSLALRNEPLGSKNYTISCELRSLDVASGQADVVLLFVDSPRQIVKLAVQSKGKLHLLGFLDGEWLPNLASIDIPSHQGEAWHELRIEVRGDEVTAVFDREHELRGSIPDGFDLGHGRWGLGALKEAVQYRKIRFK